MVIYLLKKTLEKTLKMKAMLSYMFGNNVSIEELSNR